MNATGGSIGDLTSIDDEKLIQDDQISSNVGELGDGIGHRGRMGRRGGGGGRGSLTVTTAPTIIGRTTSPFMERSIKIKSGMNRPTHKAKTGVHILPQMPPPPPPPPQQQLPPVINNNNRKSLVVLQRSVGRMLWKLACSLMLQGTLPFKGNEQAIAYF